MDNHAINCKVHNDLINSMKTSERIRLADLTLYTNGKIDSANVVTARVFAAVFVAINDLGASLNSIPTMVDLIKKRYHVELGQNCKSRPTLTNIVHSISKSMHNRLCDYIRTLQTPLVVIFDGSNDRGETKLRKLAHTGAQHCTSVHTAAGWCISCA